MANNLWKSLGSKLFNTGVAYFQQVNLVQELFHLSPEDARQRFNQYVQGLSVTARAGFGITLATLANKEPNQEVKHFIESLQAALVNPKAWTPTNTNTLMRTPIEQYPSFEDDLLLINQWYALTENDQVKVISAYLESLDTNKLEQLRIHLQRMQENNADSIQKHKENEASIVAGRYKEDQIFYRMAVLKTGQHDPNWLHQLQEIERGSEYLKALAMTVESVINRPRQTTQSVSEFEQSLEESMLDNLRQTLENDLKSGNVQGERAIIFRRMLDKMEKIIHSGKRGEMGREESINKVKQLLSELAPYLADPGPKTRISKRSPRQTAVNKLAGNLKTAVGREHTECRSNTATQRALGEIFSDLAHFQQAIAECVDDMELANLEATLLRPTALALHELSMTRHILMARPLWENISFMPKVNTLFYSGASDLLQQLESLVVEKQLNVQNMKGLQNYGQERWNALNNCHIALFDFRGAGEIAQSATLNPKRAVELTESAYELGLAFALGKPVIVLAARNERMPFDIDIAPVILDGDENNAKLFDQAIDEAFYVPQRDGRSSSLTETLGFIEFLAEVTGKRKVFEGMGWLNPALLSDPLDFLAKTELLVKELPIPSWRPLRPTWPGAYPNSDRRCFHVMPFGPEWANEVRDVTRSACKECGLIYRRGDEAEEGRIIHAIWDDICRATVVIVDLTGGNLNVMIELGIAHAIGRPVIMVERKDSVDIRPKHIEKLRVLTYESPTELRSLLEKQLKLS